MTRRSTVDELPEEIRSEIGRLMIQGATIDRIVEHLRGLVGTAPSRSAVGRYKQRMDRIGARLRRSREVTEALVRELGDQPASKTTQLNIEMMQSVIFDLFDASEDGTATVDEGGRAALQGNPEGVMMLAKALDHLTRASKSDIEHVKAVELRAVEKEKKRAGEAVTAAAKAQGLSPETVQAIRASVFGVGA